MLGHCGTNLKNANCIEPCLHAQLNAHDPVPSDVRVVSDQESTLCHVILYDLALITRSHKQDVLSKSALHEPLAQVTEQKQSHCSRHNVD